MDDSRSAIEAESVQNAITSDEVNSNEFAASFLTQRPSRVRRPLPAMYVHTRGATLDEYMNRKHSKNSTDASTSDNPKIMGTRNSKEREITNVFATRSSSAMSGSKFANVINIHHADSNDKRPSLANDDPEITSLKHQNFHIDNGLVKNDLHRMPAAADQTESDRPLEILVLPSLDSQNRDKSRKVEIPVGDLNHAYQNSDQFLENGTASTVDPKQEAPKMDPPKSDPNGPSIYFNDGQRLVDFVLVFVSGHLKKPNLSKAGKLIEKVKQRQFFEDNLRKEGLELEEDVHVHEGPQQETTTFVKIHAPWDVLCRQAEMLKLKLPTRLNDPHAEVLLSDGPPAFLKALHAVKMAASKTAAPSETAVSSDDDQKPTGITWPFSRKYMELFACDDQEKFFWPSRRQEIVWEVLQKAHNDPEDEKRRGIESLLERGVYESAFPLHDGPYECANQEKRKTREICERQKLRETWADWKCIFKTQPLGLIRKYYGEKVAFYYAFLGFYARMLIIPSVAGLITFFFGQFYAGDDEILADICEAERDPGNYTMCPLCQPPYCKFAKLHEACFNAKWDYVLDNEATIAMSVLTVVWATVMLKMWKRRQAELAFQWDTYDVKIEDCVIRPEFEERAPAKRRNPVTRELEPYVPGSKKLLWLTASTFVTLLMLCAVGGALTLIVIARVRLYWTLYDYGIRDVNVELSRWTIHGVIFVVALVFEKTYSILAGKLTSLECPRTQQEWLTSYLWKIFIFALMNDFIPLGYSAWVKGRLISTPLDLDWHTELCDSGGCMSEVTELIFVLLACRLILGNMIEIGIPFFRNTWTRFNETFKFKRANLLSRLCNRMFKKKNLLGQDQLRVSKRGRPPILQRQDSQWHHDFMLGTLEEDAVSPEYLEMLIQFMFATLFICSLPLAPLMCLINNIAEIRIDSFKFITAHRKPVPVRASGSEIWNDFFGVVVKLAIVCNGALISFTSNVLPRLYYKFTINAGHSYANFVNTSLSSLHYMHFGDKEKVAHFEISKVEYCYYEDYRDAFPPFNRTGLWYQLMCLRLAVFATFIVLSFTFQWLFNLIVSDVPAHVNLRIQRKRYVVTRAIEAMAGADAFKTRAKTGRMKSASDSERGTSGIATDRDPDSDISRRRVMQDDDRMAVDSILGEYQIQNGNVS